MGSPWSQMGGGNASFDEPGPADSSDWIAGKIKETHSNTGQNTQGERVPSKTLFSLQKLALSLQSPGAQLAGNSRGVWEWGERHHSTNAL